MRLIFWVAAGVSLLLATSVLVLAKGSVARLKHYESTCELAASKYYEKHGAGLPAAKRYEAEAGQVELCMGAKGYAFSYSGLCPEDTWGSTTRRRGIRALQEENTLCYAPNSWGSRQLYWIDNWLQKGLERISA